MIISSCGFLHNLGHKYFHGIMKVFMKTGPENCSLVDLVHYSWTFVL